MSSALKRSDFIGVWQRESISIEGGDPFEDSNVLWLHTGDYFADVRFPRPSETQAITMAFAGRAHWQSPRMRFEHEIDLTKEFTEDTGHMSFASGKLIEKGEVTVNEKVIKFEEVWTQLVSANKADYQVAKRMDGRNLGYIVRVSDFVLAMQETRDQFSAGRWQYVNKEWVLQHGFGDVEDLTSSLHSLINESLSPCWQILN